MVTLGPLITALSYNEYNHNEKSEICKKYHTVTQTHKMCEMLWGKMMSDSIAQHNMGLLQIFSLLFFFKYPTVFMKSKNRITSYTESLPCT